MLSGWLEAGKGRHKSKEDNRLFTRGHWIMKRFPIQWGKLWLRACLGVSIVCVSRLSLIPIWARRDFVSVFTADWMLIGEAEGPSAVRIRLEIESNWLNAELPP